MQANLFLKPILTQFQIALLSRFKRIPPSLSGVHRVQSTSPEPRIQPSQYVIAGLLESGYSFQKCILSCIFYKSTRAEFKTITDTRLLLLTEFVPPAPCSVETTREAKRN